MSCATASHEKCCEATVAWSPTGRAPACAASLPVPFGRQTGAAGRPPVCGSEPDAPLRSCFRKKARRGRWPGRGRGESTRTGLGGASATADGLSQLSPFALARFFIVLFRAKRLQNPLALEHALKAPQGLFERFVIPYFNTWHLVHYRRLAALCQQPGQVLLRRNAAVLVGRLACLPIGRFVGSQTPTEIFNRPTDERANWRTGSPTGGVRWRSWLRLVHSLDETSRRIPAGFSVQAPPHDPSGAQEKFKGDDHRLVPFLQGGRESRKRRSALDDLDRDLPEGWSRNRFL